MTKKKISSEQVKKKFVFQLNEESAIVSHYLQNRYTKFDKTYYEEALQLLSDYNEVTDATSGMVCESPIQYNLFNEVFAVPFSAPENPKFTFIDLFAGIGGFRIALQNLGGNCVYSSEWDTQAQKTYFANFGEVPFGDITKEETKSFVPNNFDVLCAGFPCQAFSLAGKRRGFEETRGTLFFDVAEIIKRKP